MKGLIVPVALFLMLGATACTDVYSSQTSTYSSVGRERSDADLQAATAVCDSRVGTVQIGSDVPDAYKQCMLAQGWQHDCTIPPDAYPDPHQACRACRDFMFLGVMGRECG